MTIKTENFELAVYAEGDEHADKLALVIPGRLDSKDYAHNKALVTLLATKGYYALSFDPPGVWESPGGIELFTTSNYLKAVHELIEHFGCRPTLLVGHSRGGTVSMLAGPREECVEGIIAIMSHNEPSEAKPSSVEAGYETSFRDMPPGDTKTPEQKEFKLPINYFIDGKQYDALEALKSYNKPKLFFYGLSDTTNTPAQVKEIFTAAAEPKVLCELDSTHNYRRNPVIVEAVSEKVADFVEELKATSTSTR